MADACANMFGSLSHLVQVRRENCVPGLGVAECMCV